MRALFGLTLLLVGCDDHLFPTGPLPEGGCEPTWTGVEEILVANCVVCHPGAGETDLVTEIPADVTSGAGAYIVVGDPDTSYLYDRLLGEGGESIMPLGATVPLPDETLQCVYDWIAAGAPLD